MHRGRCVSQQPSTATPPRAPVARSVIHALPTLISFPPSLILDPSNNLVYTLFLPVLERSTPSSYPLQPEPPDLLVMASRQPAGARPGAKFAQFKLVLLGRLSLLHLAWSRRYVFRN
jgi:hypothetical protein